MKRCTIVQTFNSNKAYGSNICSTLQPFFKSQRSPRKMFVFKKITISGLAVEKIIFRQGYSINVGFQQGLKGKKTSSILHFGSKENCFSCQNQHLENFYFYFFKSTTNQNKESHRLYVMWDKLGREYFPSLSWENKSSNQDLHVRKIFSSSTLVLAGRMFSSTFAVSRFLWLVLLLKQEAEWQWSRSHT